MEEQVLMLSLDCESTTYVALAPILSFDSDSFTKVLLIPVLFLEVVVTMS